jgi:guanine deaminase
MENKEKKQHKKFLKMAIDLAKKSVKSGQGGPFGAVIVKNGKVLAKANNTVTPSNDPTAHAEVNAIRKACAKLKDFQLEGCIIYASAEPCPMCLGAIYWARPKALYFAAAKDIAAKAGFDDSFIYKELKLPPSKRKIKTSHLLLPEDKDPFKMWLANPKKIKY